LNKYLVHCLCKQCKKEEAEPAGGDGTEGNGVELATESDLGEEIRNLQLEYEEQEVICHPEDLRQPVHATPQKDTDIIKCIGQIRSRYLYRDHKFKTSGRGTGTVFKTVGGKCVAITCAHNFRKQVQECEECNHYTRLYRKTKPRDQILKCKHCGSKKLKLKWIEATLVVFDRKYNGGNPKVRDDGETIEFGDLDKSYEVCIKDVIVPNDELYRQYSKSRDGYDLAYFSFDDDGYYEHLAANIRLKSYESCKLQLEKRLENPFRLFGFPADKWEEIKHGEETTWRCPMYGMSSHADGKGEFKAEKTRVDGKKFYIRHDCIDTYGGQSGSALWFNDGNKYVIFGVHTAGVKKSYNLGQLLDDESIRTINTATEIAGKSDRMS